jgi:D-lactate dehydrogenase (cytochrome)
MKTVFGKENIRQNLPDILSDESRFSLGTPQSVYFPQTIRDVVEVARESSRKSVPLTIIGARTGITGGCVPVEDCIAVCFSDMNKILRVDRKGDGLTLACQPGVTLRNIADFLEAPGQVPYPVQGSELLKPGAWFYPPDPTEMTAQLGGTVATNASGARSYHFGPTRAHIEELSLVLADGDTLTLRRGEHPSIGGVFSTTTDQGASLSIPAPRYQSPSIKNASGYYSKNSMDLIDLFIGSEGTLGIYTEVSIRLREAPRLVAGLSFFQGLKQSFAFADFLRGQPAIAAIEYFDESALAFVRTHPGGEGDIPAYPAGKPCAVYWEFLETIEAPFEAGLDKWETALAIGGSSLDATWSGFDAKEVNFLRSFRHRVPEAVNTAVALYKRTCPTIRKISTDSAFPRDYFLSSMETYISHARSAGLEYALFGHLGDFHLHLNLLPHNADELDRALAVYEKIMDLAVECKGTVSAEHGIGKIKKPYLVKMYGEEAVEEMMRVKSGLDPRWLLNPGTLFTR